MNIAKILLNKITDKSQIIDQFFQEKLKNPLFYNSVDLRHSGFKIAPVDVNCFPAGFNNLSTNSKEKAKKIVSNFFDNYPFLIKKIIILAEDHTRNLKYLENLLSLQEILTNVGQKEVIIGTFNPEIDHALTIDLDNGRQITLEKLIKNHHNISTKNGFCADIIISNNDFTKGLEPILNGISQQIIPSPSLGWHLRKKSNHFTIYNNVVVEFCQLIDLDPWLISTIHQSCIEINFKEKKGIICLAEAVENIISQIQQKYQQYNIKSQPYCYVKSDNGTYGMAIMTVKSGSELLTMNKKDRNKMSNIKGSVQNTNVIIQEGITTQDLVKKTIAEPMIYLVGGEVVGNLFRVNNERDANINLNSAGMAFFALDNLDNEELEVGLNKTDIAKVYSVLARLSALAASREVY